ncbi:hypothetical protein ANN_14066 [Periplaneta americana]|uniref:Uncharacterized protein n=1 Tax=Periplaneta americana TaxID=6978 RepID=A0ABQ8SWR4_PERAM|nr:hypothetical protein ANN_14066 [Periplaneta americana]
MAADSVIAVLWYIHGLWKNSASSRDRNYGTKHSEEFGKNLKIMSLIQDVQRCGVTVSMTGRETSGPGFKSWLGQVTSLRFPFNQLEQNGWHPRFSPIFRAITLDYSSGRQHSLKCAMDTLCSPMCVVVQQGEIESIPASSYESTIVHCVFRGIDINLQTVSQALVCGYLVRVIEERVNCDMCISNISMPKVSTPLMDIIRHQDRGGLKYPKPYFATPHAIFQRDNVRSHVARIVQAFFEERRVSLLSWPARSPDISPIEHVWDMVCNSKVLLLVEHFGVEGQVSFRNQS